jgi:predicted metal-dependent peptidase
MNLKNRLSRVTTEVLALAKLVHIERIHFIDWDGEVERHEVYSSDQLEQADMTLKPRGGGGTDPSCVSDYLREHNIKPDCIIMATDGEVGNWGTWQSPLLWVITNNDPIVAPVGKSIHVEDD